MRDPRPTIIYTLTDEAPALATYSLLPILRAFAAAGGVAIESRDISLSARILAAFPERLGPDRDVHDTLAELGARVRRPDANIIKLPNISASVPQVKEAIAELRAKGFDLPDYPDEPADASELDTRLRYDKIKGSAVNPVLREGNSDRRAPVPVKAYARNHPHGMGAWAPDSATRVAHMASGDFRSNERSQTFERADTLRIELVGDDGQVRVLRPSLDVQAGDVLDATLMQRRALRDFLARSVDEAREAGLLLSLHLKATMMKVSDPIIFGQAVQVYFQNLFARHAPQLEAIGANPNEGLASIEQALAALPPEQAAVIEAEIRATLEAGPALAMVDSGRGITNLHVPSDVIVDASMPAMIRQGGKMWNARGELQDTLALIPDASYAGVYQTVIDDCKSRGALDPRTMGSVANVGLMAQKAEEYGSHDKTFEIEQAGELRVVDQAGGIRFRQRVEPGDIWRMCQTRDAAIRDWVKLALARARATGTPAVFWLDATRAHDAQLIAKVESSLAEVDTSALDLRILSPEAATRFTLDRLREGKDTISVTGNVLRDYLTDLFPILELGTSAKMLSIVPLMAGGGLFETGAGGSAPKHVQQFLAENHLRWDSLGEFLALAASLAHLASFSGSQRAAILGETLDQGTTRYLEEGRSPSRRVGELDNRGSHYFLARYWAEALAAQDADPELASRFAGLASALARHEPRILAELAAGQGAPVDIGGYYAPDPGRCQGAMRPSETLNRLLASFESTAEP